MPPAAAPEAGAGSARVATEGGGSAEEEEDPGAALRVAIAALVAENGADTAGEPVVAAQLVPLVRAHSRLRVSAKELQAATERQLRLAPRGGVEAHTTASATATAGRIRDAASVAAHTTASDTVTEEAARLAEEARLMGVVEAVVEHLQRARSSRAGDLARRSAAAAPAASDAEWGAADFRPPPVAWAELPLAPARALHSASGVDALSLFSGSLQYGTLLLLTRQPAEARRVLRRLVGLGPRLLSETRRSWGYSAAFCRLETLWLEAYGACVVAMAIEEERDSSSSAGEEGTPFYGASASRGLRTPVLHPPQPSVAGPSSAGEEGSPVYGVGASASRGVRTPLTHPPQPSVAGLLAPSHDGLGVGRELRIGSERHAMRMSQERETPEGRAPEGGRPPEGRAPQGTHTEHTQTEVPQRRNTDPPQSGLQKEALAIAHALDALLANRLQFRQLRHANAAWARRLAPNSARTAFMAGEAMHEQPLPGQSAAQVEKPTR